MISCYTVFVTKPYLRIRQKSKEPKEIDPLGEGNSPKSGDDRIGQVFFAYIIAGSIGFEWGAIFMIGLGRMEGVNHSWFHI